MPSWFEVRVDVPKEFAEVVASLLFDLGSPGLECSDHDGVTSLVAYFRDLPSLEALRRECAAVGDRAGAICSPVIRSRRIDEQDWGQNWKRHFHPTAVGERLLICPPWDSSISTDRTVIVIDPGMAFGTGQHPTTRGCLELIERAVATSKVTRALDVGTGSGILAIALAALGVPSVCAVDNDPAARQAAAGNSERNATAGSVEVAAKCVDLAEHFDLVVANLFTNLLHELAEDFSRQLTEEGVLICSGFLVADEAAVIGAYPGFKTINRYEEDGWVALSLSRKGS